MKRPASFDADLVAYMPTLMRMARKYTRDQETARDHVQTACMLALAAWQQFEPGTNFKGWLSTILYNACRTGSRKARIVPMPVDHAIIVDWVTIPAPQDSQVYLNEVLSLGRHLAPQDREAVIGRALGETQEEQAAVCGVEHATIRSRLFRGRARLRELVEA